MADHYRGLAQSLVNLGFLFKRQGEGRREVWRNRQTDQEVAFDRDEVAKSRAAADAVLAAAQAAKLPRKTEGAAVAKPPPRKSLRSPKPASKTSHPRATSRKGAGPAARDKGKR